MGEVFGITMINTKVVITELELHHEAKFKNEGMDLEKQNL